MSLTSDFIKRLTSVDFGIRDKAWRKEARIGLQDFSLNDIDSLWKIACGETDERLRNWAGFLLTGRIISQLNTPLHNENISHEQRSDPKSTYEFWPTFWRWFRRDDASGKPLRCAVVGITEEQHVHDVEAILELSRFLSRKEYPDVEFYPVPLRNSDWSRVNFERCDAVCFVGRPGMFNYSALKSGAHPRRFVLPDPAERYYEVYRFGVTPDSVRDFHHIEDRFQNRRFETRDEPHFREDYALIRRSIVDFGDKKMPCVFLAGATSLGTFAASRFATGQTPVDMTNIKLKDEDDVEILIKSNGPKHNPAQPWTLNDPPKLEGIWINGLRECGPLEIAFEIDPSNHKLSKTIRFDGMPVTANLSPTANRYLTAICTLILNGQTNELNLKQVFETTGLPGKPDDLAKEIRNCVKDQWLCQQATVTGKSKSDSLPSINCRFKVIALSGNATKKSLDSTIQNEANAP